MFPVSCICFVRNITHHSPYLLDIDAVFFFRMQLDMRPVLVIETLGVS